MTRAVGFLLIFGVWEVAARRMANPIFPPVTKVIPALVAMIVSGEIIRHSLVSLTIIFLGFLIASVFGISAGVLIYRFRAVRLVLMPVVDAMRPVAALTLLPLLVLLLGIGVESKTAVIFWTAWPPILLNTVQGLNMVDQDYINAAQLDGGTHEEILRFITIPLAMPLILTGLRIGLAGGWISLIAAEMLGSSAGLGYSILSYSQSFRFPDMYAIIIVIALLGLSMTLVLNYAQSRANFEEDNHEESKYIRFGDRAVGFVMDTVRVFNGK